jgi:hypothetical protein
VGCFIYLAAPTIRRSQLPDCQHLLSDRATPGCRGRKMTIRIDQPETRQFEISQSCAAQMGDLTVRWGISQTRG